MDSPYTMLNQIKSHIPSSIKAVLKRFPVPLSQNHKYDLYTKKLLKKYLSQDSHCIDVGCYKGEILDLFLKYSPQGKHLAFEPIQLNFKHLSKKYEHTANVDLYNYALSNTKGTSDFHHVTSNPSYSGLKMRRYEKEEKIEIIKVKTFTLDSLDIKTNIDLIKIDVEGAEYLVLEGAKETITGKTPIIIFEHGKGASEFYGYSSGDLHDLLQEMKLKIYTFESFFDKKKPLHKNEFIKQFEEELNYYFVAYQ